MPHPHQMTNHLGVLLIESHPGVGADSASTLQAAGHRVSRCVDPEAADSFPCRGVVDPSGCPVEGHVDVALVVRHTVDAPTAVGHGLGCATRAGIPVVAAGPVGTDVLAACERAAAEPARALSSTLLERISGLLEANSLDPSVVDCDVSLGDDGARVVVSIDAPIDERFRQAVAVRVFDAVRDLAPVKLERIDVAVVGSPQASS